MTYWLSLAAEPSAVAWGRRHVARALWEWGLAHLIDSAELITSELLTNAVRASAPTEARQGVLVQGKMPLVAVRVGVFGPTVRIEVWDTSRALPRARVADEDSEDGRGLTLVAAMSQRWDAWLPPTGGKVVFAELSAAPSPVTVAAPERVAVQAPAPVAVAAPRQPPFPQRVRRPGRYRITASLGVIEQVMARLATL
jgi:anti-sigma regulatory factor (Ser/Thr protein kinase)